MKGLVHIYEGNGKGKTTAGVGLAVRCAGCGFPVVYSQFLKDGCTGEMAILRNVPEITVMVEEKHFPFSFLMTPEQKVEACGYYTSLFEKVTAYAKETQARLLVMDEILDLCNAELIDLQLVTTFLKNKPEELEVVMTGRNPKPELVELADYYTKMEKVKHPFDQGVKARVGIEK
ncbi:MAG: cob(I)yrinic acid a,c-diamide adenosyltransferase [Eubacterium sp.]|nr:cob(I)yrinic acid a,c-diamide adenosyltransferase [Eubacterium sp.]